jgi:hypothetical protein
LAAHFLARLPDKIAGNVLRLFPALAKMLLDVAARETYVSKAL